MLLFSPKRQRILNFPKNQQRKLGMNTQRNLSIQSNKQRRNSNFQFSFNLNDSLNDNKNISLCEQINIRRDKQDNLYTLNPEQQVQIRSDAIHNNSNSVRKYSIKRQKYNHSPLEDRSSKDLAQKQQKDHNLEDSLLKSRQKFIQIPLEQEKPKHLNINLKKLQMNHTIQAGNKQIQQIKSKLMHRTIDRTKIKSVLSKSQKNSQSDVLFKTAKKLSNLKSTYSNLQIRLNQDLTFQKQAGLNKSLPKNRLEKLKADVNQFLLNKSKNKSKINVTNQTFIEDQNQVKNYFEQTVNTAPSQLGNSQRNFYSIDNRVKIYQQPYQQNQGYNTHYSNWSPKFNKEAVVSSQLKRYQITYKTSLSQLKNIQRAILSSKSADIQVLVPKILMDPHLTRAFNNQKCYNHAKYIFQSLGLPTDNLSVKKYSNCVLMVDKNICIMIKSEGKIYLGGWKNKYFDEGGKHGLGLQWIPNQCIYYGQFENSKKNGFGIMKNISQTFIGNWQHGKRADGIIINQNGKIFHSRASANFDHKTAQNQGTFESDPFM